MTSVFSKHDTKQRRINTYVFDGLHGQVGRIEAVSCWVAVAARMNQEPRISVITIQTSDP